MQPAYQSGPQARILKSPAGPLAPVRQRSGHPLVAPVGGLAEAAAERRTRWNGE